MVNQVKVQEIINQELPRILKLEPNAWLCIGKGYESFNRIEAGKKIAEMLKMMGFTSHWDPRRFSVCVSDGQDPWISLYPLEELKGYEVTHYILDDF
jgi:hypothetical protein